jgi:hypothetical protein
MSSPCGRMSLVCCPRIAVTDSIIDEVRALRQQHAASFGFDLDRIYADLQARQIKHADEGWTIIPAPVAPPPEPDLALQRVRFARR